MKQDLKLNPVDVATHSLVYESDQWHYNWTYQGLQVESEETESEETETEPFSVDSLCRMAYREVSKELTSVVKERRELQEKLDVLLSQEESLTSRTVQLEMALGLREEKEEEEETYQTIQQGVIAGTTRLLRKHGTLPLKSILDHLAEFNRGSVGAYIHTATADGIFRRVGHGIYTLP